MSEPEKNAPSDLASLERKIRELAKPRPLYTPKSVRPVYALRYDWTGWPTEGTLLPPNTVDAIHACKEAWLRDGLELGEYRVDPRHVQLLFDATPTISPVLCTARAKGRLQHALRQGGTQVTFSRKVSFRSLGENIRAAVEGYLGKQVRKEGFADPRFARRMELFTVEDTAVDLALPTETSTGRYWYNLHLVLVVDGRRKIVDNEMLAKIRDGVRRISKKKGFGLKAVSVMLDHVHMALRGTVEASPEEMALGFLNNLAFLLGRNRVWQDGYYVGTFSEYGMDVIRRLAD